MDRYKMLVWMVNHQYGGLGQYSVRLSEFAKAYKVSRSTLSRMINEAIEANLIERVGHGTYRLTEDFYDAMTKLRGYGYE